MKRRSISLILFSLLVLVLSSCGGRKTLLFLNWGEYVDESLLTAFENKYNCNVLMDLGESNEIFYSKLKAGTTVYDVITPSDYMVEKMYKNDLLEKLDFSKLENYKPKSEDIRKGITSIDANMGENTNSDITNYYVPYLWGTWGIMYTTKKAGLEQAVVGNTNQWASLFDRKSLPANTKVAMYDSHQHAYYAACRYLGIDVYEEQPTSKLLEIRDLISNMKYNAWGTDTIKKDIVAGNIDVGFMWTGDFLYYFCENAAKTVMDAYLANDITNEEFAEMLDVITSEERVYKTSKGSEYQIGFDLFIPDDTVAFCDNFVITKDSANKDLAYKFIDFMCSKEVDDVTPALSNTYYVCYDTPFNSVYDEILALSDIEYDSETVNELKSDFSDPYDGDLYWSFYDYAISRAFERFYPKDGQKGSILASFSRQYIKQINTAFNNARA